MLGVQGVVWGRGAGGPGGNRGGGLGGGGQVSV